MRVNVQSNGVAVVLYRASNAISRCARVSRSAKSAGLMTLRWSTEKTISIWFNHEAWTGRWTRMAVGHAVRIRSIEARPAWEDPLSTTQNTRRAEAYGSLVITTVHQVGERGDPGRGRDLADQVGVVHVVGAEVGQRATAFVLELHPAIGVGPAGSGGWQRRSACSWDFSSALIT